ncbi:predicted protein [Nematostella vectensis]|uniref:Glucose dehydrogenase C-terminal domain-containing protein n=2 Tax=Nematostella vectensis TaxID=45351 RepID=A7RSK1_NEMVE|nr:predicted protein [Nematostella vectensis]|eukprot:XP_001637640.1 predicted protein [Nematostella vectensis]
MVAAVDEIHKRRTGQKETTRKRMALIQGAGLLGIYGCALLHEAGYDKVYCSDISSERLKMVSRFAGIPLGPDQEHLEKNSIDTVIEVCGVRQVLSEGIRVLRPGGTYVLVGMVHPDSRLDMVTAEQIIRKCLTIKGVHNYGPLHLDQAVSFIDQTASKFPYADLFSPTYRLENITSAFELAEEQKYFRVLIEPREHIP